MKEQEDAQAPDGAPATKARSVVCIAGWHFEASFYHAVFAWPGTDVFVVSHRELDEIPDEIVRTVSPERILCRPNRGYDWGCYEQFLETGFWKQYEYVFFMHDDLTLRKDGLVSHAIDLLSTCAVVANGRVNSGKIAASVASESYAHSHWKPPTSAFEHDEIRGSFFATTRIALGALGRFEVFWDPFHVTSATGNWSTRASCGKWQELLGPRCFGYISDKPCESEYLLEHVRGDAEGRSPGEPERLRAKLARFLWNRVYAALCKRYLSIRWGEYRGLAAPLQRALIRRLVALMSGCPLDAV